MRTSAVETKSDCVDGGGWRRAGSRRIALSAIQAFAERGYDGVSLRLIASNADVYAALIVHHFGSKSGVWRAAGDRVAELLAIAVDRLSTAPAADAVIERVSNPSVLKSLTDLPCAAQFVAQFIVKQFVQQRNHFDYVSNRSVWRMHAQVAPTFAKHVRDERSTANAFVQFFPRAGASATCVAARSCLIRLVPAATDDGVFRRQLKATIVDQFLPQQQGDR